MAIFNYFREALEPALLGQVCATIFVLYTVKLLFLLRTRRLRHLLFAHYGIPGPEPSLLDENYRLYRQDQANHKADDYCRAKYGKTYGIHIGNKPHIMTTDLELLKGVFLDEVGIFQGRILKTIETPINESILFAEYERWKVYHKLMSPSFAGHKVRGSESLEHVENSVKLMLNYIDGKFSGDTCKIELDIQDLLKATALHIISQMAIDLPVEVKEQEKHVKGLDGFLGSVGRGIVDLTFQFPFLLPPINFIARRVQFFDSLTLIIRNLDKKIAEQANSLSTPARSTSTEAKKMSVLDMLIKAYYDGKISRKEVIGNCLAILVAGYDTTSTTLTYIFWALAKHQDIQEKLRVNLMTYGTESQYLEQVINETMRLYPTIITFAVRIANETVKIGNVTVPQGTSVVYNSWLVHRDPQIWPDPTKFDPDRFKLGIKHHPCAFAPFGLGFRKCLGYRLAMMEIKMITCDVLTRYRLSVLSPSELNIVSYSNTLSKPRETVKLQLEKLS